MEYWTELRSVCGDVVGCIIGQLQTLAHQFTIEELHIVRSERARVRREECATGASESE